MELEHSFTIPVGVDDAWQVLRDIERIGPCIPGGTIDSVDGEDFTGQVKVKVGAIAVTYRGSARFTDVDPEAHAATIRARGQEKRGGGTAQATVTATLTDHDGETDVRMVTNLAITGKPAQFGRGTLAEVGNKLVTQFAHCLSQELSGEGRAEPEPAPQPSAATPGEPGTGDIEEPSPWAADRAARPRPGDQPIDLLEVGGAPVAKRLAPVAAVLALVVLLRLVRRAAARR